MPTKLGLWSRLVWITGEFDQLPDKISCLTCSNWLIKLCTSLQYKLYYISTNIYRLFSPSEKHILINPKCYYERRVVTIVLKYNKYRYKTCQSLEHLLDQYSSISQSMEELGGDITHTCSNYSLKSGHAVARCCSARRIASSMHDVSLVCHCPFWAKSLMRRVCYFVVV